MAEITIIALIYQSPQYARGFYECLRKSTPELEDGTADFFFIANNANSSTLKVLRKEGIPHYELELPVLSNEDHALQGFAAPEYLGRVYEAYNFGVFKSSTDLILLLNSDMVMSPGWLPRLLDLVTQNTVLSPTLVERRHPKFGTYPGAVEANFGSSFQNFDWRGWEKFTALARQAEVVDKSELPYMPSLVRKAWFENLGGFPHGNIQGPGGYNSVASYGDEYFFGKLRREGVSHKSVDGVYCYHFKEGERAASTAIFLKDILIPALVFPVLRILRAAYRWAAREIRKKHG